MNFKKTAKYLAISAIVFALLATVPAYAPSQNPLMSSPPRPPFPPFAQAYPAQINATGTLTLKEFLSGNVSDAMIDTNFTSLVPDLIAPGKYANVGFHGFAVATATLLIRFDGLLVANGINFWAAFTVPKPKDISVGKYSANSNQLNLNISEFTLPPAKITMVMMKGSVTKFGENNASGFLEAHAKIGTNNFTQVHTSFTLQPPPRSEAAYGEEETTESPKNFSISHYIVTLVNATKTELDYDGSALYVEGLWNVYNRTVTVTFFDHADSTTTVNVHTLLEKAPGKFNVTLPPQLTPTLFNPDEGKGEGEAEEGRWKTRGNFTLEIQGLAGIIKGNVIFYHAKFADPHELDIPRCDFNLDHVVNIVDLSQVARAYGAKLGEMKFDYDADVNSDFVINILDLAKAGQEFGREY
jgi:hypothetical protein